MNQIDQTNDVEEREIHLYDYIEVLLRKKWIVISCFVVIVLAAGIGTYLATPIYEATTSILIEEAKGGGQALFTELAGLPQTSEIPSQIEIIKSRTIAEDVVRELKYDQRVFDISGDLDLRVINLQVPEKFIDEEIEVEFTDDKGNFTVTREGESLGRGIAGILFKSNSGLSFVIKEVNPEKGASFKIKRSRFYEAVEGLQKKVTVSPVRNTNIVYIKVQDSDPRMAAAIANSIVKRYIQQDISRRSKEATYMIKFVKRQIEPTQKKLENALESLAAHKRNSRVVDLKEGTKKLIENIGALEKEKINLEIKEQQVRYLYDEVQRNITDTSTLNLSVLEDPVVQSMISRLAMLENNRKSLLAEYTARHPQVVALSAEINEIKRRVNSSILNTLDSLRSKKDSFTKEIERLRAELKVLPEEEKRLAGLVLNKEVLSNINAFLFQKLNEATITQASTISSIQVVDPAIVPEKPIKPQKKKNILLAVVVGLMSGIGFAFFFDYLDNSIKSPRDVEERLGLPVFGHIPLVQAEEPKKKPLSGKRSNSGLITLDSTKSIVAESFRSLRTNLQFAVLEKRGRVFHFTSPMQNEGKTTITANLGITLALMGSRTLIIDLDLRKPRMHHIFDISREPGITHLLAGKSDLKEIIRPTATEHLYVIPAGIIPPNPSELLSQQDLSDFLDKIKNEFDYILIDSPPVLPVTDSLLLGRLADTSFIVIKLGGTSFPAVEQAIKQLRSVNVNVAGAIINKIKLSSGYGYYHNYYHYYYGEESPETNKN
ncbi:MAG: polysaccharide biosynthesis tyrosine autokinase [Nitrospirota bacterium]|nr:polysaccharide biosynthesis tyrosine autokinase [Nitrospirota bacterium]